MKKITYTLIFITILLFLGSGVFPKNLKADESSEEKNEKLDIITVTKKEYDMVKSIVKDRHNVIYLLDDEKKIEEFEINNQILNKISSKELFIHSGFYYKNWIDSFIDEVSKEKVRVVDISRGIKAIPREINMEDDINSNYMLNFDEYKIAIYNIKLAVQDLDTQNRNVYDENYYKYINEVKRIVDEKRFEIKKSEKCIMVTNTDVFDYLFKGLGIEVVKVKNIKDINGIQATNKNKNIFFIKDSMEVLQETNGIISNVIELSSYDGSKSAIELILNNMDLIVEGLKKIEKNS